MRDKILYGASFGFVLGVLWRSFIFTDFYINLLIGVVSLALFLFFYLVSKNKWGIIFSIFLLMFSFGVFRFHISDKSAPENFESKVDVKSDFAGEIIDEPDIRETNQKLTVEVNESNNKTEILLTTGLDENYKYGDSINFRGKLEKPENFETDYGKEFDYVNYLRKDGIFYIMSYPSIEVVDSGGGSIVKRTLFSAKEKFLEKMNLEIPEPESLLMGGLILGEKSSFSQALRQSFVNTGTIHIVALSGYNVTIVAEWIMKMLAFLPRNIAFGGGILGIILFVIMAGGQSTAVRAGIMASLALIARATGRTYDVGRGLILAGVVMILINPFVLVYDVSFQLSFIATVAVIFLAPRIEHYFAFIKWKWLRDIVAVTFSAYIFVLPFILYKMGNLSLIALPANFLVLPFIPLTMILGFITGFAGLIFFPLSLPFGYLSYFLLHYELAVVSFFSNIPFAAIVLPNFPLTLTLAIYAIFIHILFGKSIKKLLLEN
jgi:competence protein ComEC